MREAAVALVVASCAQALFACAASAAAHGYALRVRFTSAAASGSLAAGALGAALIVHVGSHSPLAAVALVCAACAVSTVTDMQAGYIFDAVTLPALAAIVLVCAIGGDGIHAVLGAAAGSGTLLLLYVLTRGKGLGLGDVKLAACIGAVAGAAGIIWILGAAFIMGGTWAAVLLARRRARRGDHMRFGPYLAAGFLAAAGCGVLR